jgi:hypothetical protein
LTPKKVGADEKEIDRCFGSEAPAGQEGRWIKDIPGRGLFIYLRFYGPEQAALDGTWKPGDFEEVK